MNFYAGKPVVVAKANFDGVHYCLSGSATVVSDLPDVGDVADWHELRHRDLIFICGEHEPLVEKAKAMGHGRIGILDMRIDPDNPGSMPGGMHAIDLLATAREEVRKTATAADVSIVETPAAFPRQIPLDGLGSLGEVVHMAADHAATHRDFVSVLVWPALSGVTGGSVLSAVSGGHKQPAILYGCIVSPPGGNKTGAYRALEPGKRAVERWAEEDHLSAMALWEVDNAGKKKVDRDKAPARQLIRVSNATAEAAMMVLHQQGRGLEFQIEELAVALPQLGVNAGGGYSNSAPLAGLWLRGFDGGRYDYTRRTVGDEPLVIRNFATAISCAAQPDVLADFFNSPRRDGAPDRLMLAYPDDYDIERTKGVGDADDVNAELARMWVELRKATLALERQNAITGDMHIEVRFDPEAVLMFERWRRHLMAAAKFLPPAAMSARMKAVSQFVRMAGLSGFVRHVIDGAPLQVTTDVAACTVETMRGVLDHRAKTEKFLAEPVRERRARELAREICFREAYTFRPSDVRREWRLSLCRDESSLRDALVELGELGWLKSKVSRGLRDALPPVIAVVDEVLREARGIIFKKKGA